MTVHSLLFKERQEPCPKCNVMIDFSLGDYALDRTVIKHCPRCNQKLRITKKLRKLPRAEQGIYFIVKKCLKEGSGRWRG